MPCKIGISKLIDDWHFYLAAIPAVILMGLSKGGFSGLSLLSTPLLALAISPVRAAAIMLPILLVQDAVSVMAFRRSFDRRVLLMLLPGSVFGVFLGWLLAAHVSDVLVGAAVGLIAVGFVALAAWRGRAATTAKPAAARQVAPVPATFWAAASGFTSFVSHAGAPTFQVYVLPLALPVQVYVGTSTMFFAATNLLKVLPYLLLGQFSVANLDLSAMLIPVAIGSTFVGIWLVRRVSQAGFLHIIYGLTFLVGCKLILDGAQVLLAR